MKPVVYIGISILFSLLINGCSPESERRDTTSEWRLLYQHDTAGRLLEGKREHLINAMKRGSPVKVSWGVKLPNGETCIEFAEPIFTTMVNDTGLIVQFPLSYIQTSYMDAGTASFRLPPMGWRGIMTTNGRFDAFMYDLETGKVVRKLSQRANMSWYALAPDPAYDNRVIPELAKENGIFLDSAGTFSK
jgi:hypothetical protein